MATAGKVDLAGDGFFVLVDLLEEAKVGLPDEVPSPLDDRFSEIASAYRKADPALRRQVREQIPAEYWLPLLQLSDRCAEWALVDKDPRHIEDGLTAYCLEDLSLRRAREPGSPEPPLVRGQDVARRHRGDLQPGRAMWLAAGIAGAEQFLGEARGGEVSAGAWASRNIRKEVTSAFAPETPKGRSRRSREGGASVGHLNRYFRIVQITWRILRNKVSCPRL